MFPRGHATNGLITRNTRNRDETGSFNSLPRKSLSRQVQKKMTRFNMRQLSLQFILYTFVNHTRQKQKHVRDALNFSNYHLSKCSFEQRYRIPCSAKPFILTYPRLPTIIKNPDASNSNSIYFYNRASNSISTRSPSLAS